MIVGVTDDVIRSRNKPVHISGFQAGLTNKKEIYGAVDYGAIRTGLYSVA